MQIINTAGLNEKTIKDLSPDEVAHIYNGLDVCVTAEVYNTLKAQLDDDTEGVQQTYANAMAKLAPIMEMSLRGTLIDEEKRQKVLRDFERQLTDLNKKFQQLSVAITETEMNWASPVQVKNLFYGIMGIKEIKKRNAKGIFAATTNEEALEKIAANHIYARPLANFILAMRDLQKRIGFLKTEIDADQRMRTTYNIAGTNTGRLASSMSEFGTGTNLQNVNRALREPFVADEGMYMVNVDLEQADGRNVGAILWNLFYDMTRDQISELNGEKNKLGFIKDWEGPVGEALAGAYLDACESGDLHTTVCRMVWPEELNGIPWPEDESTWKKFCDGEIAHGQDSYRQLSKKGGHGTNYYGTPRTMGKHLHTPTRVIQTFQNLYFGAFPAIPLWHKWVIREIETHGTITTLFGRRRMFFGRGNDASTHRKAIAYAPQSMTGEQIDRGLLQIWRAFPRLQLLNQVHDSILFQIPYSQHRGLIKPILETMKVELTLKGGRKFFVPLDAQGGWNWGKFDYEKPQLNPHGLRDWKGEDNRTPPKKTMHIRDYFKK